MCPSSAGLPVFPAVDTENFETEIRSFMEYKLVADLPVPGYSCNEISCSYLNVSPALDSSSLQQITEPPQAPF